MLCDRALLAASPVSLRPLKHYTQILSQQQLANLSFGGRRAFAAEQQYRSEFEVKDMAAVRKHLLIALTVVAAAAAIALCCSHTNHVFTTLASAIWGS